LIKINPHGKHIVIRFIFKVTIIMQLNVVMKYTVYLFRKKDSYIQGQLDSLRA